MGIQLTCPNCHERMTFDLATTTVRCKHCGYQPSTGLDDRAAELRARGPRPSVSISNENEINPRAVSLFYTAHDFLFDNQKADALRALQSAVDIQPDFLDAHLWIAKISDDPATKREHLSVILAYNSGHMEATRMMLVLNGRLTPEQAARTYDDHEPFLQTAEGPVATETATLRCPNCKGDLSVDDASGEVFCRFCGYRSAKPGHSDSGGDLLLAAMLERRATPVKWLIGERLLHCNECGAERTLTASQLSMRCPFCGSNHVIEQDALGSFEQPDGLIPFTISREQAGACIKEQLRSFSERVKGWFDQNKVASATLSGYYLPFWMFDASVEINQTRIVNNSSNDRRSPNRPAYSHNKLNDAMYDLEVCAVQSPLPALTCQLGDYHLGEMVAYDPTLLAKYPAQLYTIDFDKAALEARTLISHHMRAKYGVSESREVSVNVFSNIQQMSFRLVLAPVWIAQLVEEDHDHRTALVNGQTGKVVLGKAEKPTTTRLP